MVLDPILDKWAADVLTADPEYFMELAMHPETECCALFIDESGEMIGQYNTEMFTLATRSRHKGHNTHLITQRANSLNPTVRTQCAYLFLFNS